MNGNPVGLLCIALASLGVLVLWLTIWWKIFDKAGYGGGFAFLFLIPVIGVLLMFLILAFGD